MRPPIVAVALCSRRAQAPQRDADRRPDLPSRAARRLQRRAGTGHHLARRRHLRRAGARRRRGAEWLRVDAASGRHDAALRRRAHGDGARGAARRHARRAARRGALERPDVQRRAHRRAAHHRRRPLLLRLRRRPRGAADDGRRRRRGGDVQPRRPLRRLRPRQQPVRRRASPSQRERALTTDGSAEILNGKLDWLYQEEIYGRGRFRAYWWSPDSTRLAFLQLDERPVPEYTVVDHIPYRPDARGHRLPEGRRPEPDREARHRRASAGGDPRWVDLDSYSGGRLPDRQRRLDAGLAQVVLPGAGPRADVARPEPRRPASGQPRTRAARDDQGVGERERQPGLAEGRLVPLVQRAQRLQAPLSLPAPTARCVRQVTTGRWDVRTLYGVDESDGLRLLHVAGAQRDRHRHLPRQARRQRHRRGCRSRPARTARSSTRRSRGTSACGAT